MNNRGSVLIFLLLITGVISFFLMQSLYYAKLNQKLCYNYYNKLLFKNKLEKLTIVFSELARNKMLYNDYFDEDILNYFKSEKKILIDKDTFFVTLKRENELVDLNVKNEVKIKDAIKSMMGDSYDEINILQIADSILDWMDKDDLKRLNGAEKDDYKNFGYMPANRKLYNIFELQKIKYIDDKTFFHIEKDDNEISYKGLLTIFTTYKNGFSKYSPALKKDIYYKNILRLYVRTANKDQLYILFIGENKGRYRLLLWKRII